MTSPTLADNDSDFGLCSASQIAAAIREGEISSAEAVEHYLNRIQRLNPALNAVVITCEDRARAEALDLDRRAAADDFAGPLHGLPITIKDAIATAGIRSTSGAPQLAANVPSVDATVVDRLRKAGAVVIGKTNLPAWSSDIQTYNDLFGTTNNPWDLARSPGGSSGGAGAAVAAALSAFDIGSDVGGSIRIPASFCGVFGHKPTYGIVPQSGYMDRLEGGSSQSDLNVLGPLARHPDDLALVLSVIAGAAPEDAGWRLDLPAPRHQSLQKYRLAVWLDDGAFELDRSVGTVLRRAVDRLSDAGVMIEYARPPIDFHEAVDLYRRLVYGAASVHHPGDTGAELAGNHRDWLQADFRRRELMAIWEEWFGTYDALLCPVIPVPALVHDHEGTARHRGIVINGAQMPHLYGTAWTGLIGSSYLPATALPVGRTGEGLPVGVQIVAKRYDDKTTIHLAGLINEVLGEYAVPPMAT